VSRKRNKQVYAKFPLVPETEIDGWVYGAITYYIDPELYPKGTDNGDGYVQAPDGSRAGLVWDIGKPRVRTIDAETDDWGLYHVWFPKPIKTVKDLKKGFELVLPSLQRMYKKRMNTRK
jgi:hypothetical protein